MEARKFRMLSVLVLGAVLLASAGSLAAQDEWISRAHYSSIGFTMGYNTFSPAGNTRYVQYSSEFKSTGGFALGFRALWSPNILGHFLSIGGEYQGLAIANYNSDVLYYVESGKPVTSTDYADLWQFLVGLMFVNNEHLILQAQFGYGSWTSEWDFTEAVASVRLVAAFPIIGRIVTIDPEIAYYKGLGAFKNSAFSIQLGLAFRI